MSMRDPLSRPFQRGDELEAVRFETLRKMAESAAAIVACGNGVRMYEDASGQKVFSVDEPPPARPATEVTVFLNNDRDGDAWYGAQVFRSLADPVDTTTDGVDAAVGEATGIEVSVLNLRELNGNSVTGHDLRHADNPSRWFRGWYTGQVDEEGRQVVHIDGMWISACTPATEG